MNQTWSRREQAGKIDMSAVAAFMYSTKLVLVRNAERDVLDQLVDEGCI